MLRHTWTIPFLFPTLLVAQDTLRIDLPAAEALLQRNSLELVVQRYAVDVAAAEKIQARLFHNPSVMTEWSAFAPGPKFFDVGEPNGQKAVTVEQLFRIGGQRSLAIRAAGERVRISEAEYAELAAALRAQLHAALYHLHYTERSIDAIDSQLGVLKNIVDAYGKQAEKGNVSMREVTRLRASYFSLNSQRAELARDINATRADLSVLLGTNAPIAFSTRPNDLLAMRPLAATDAELIAAAERDRPKLMAARAGLEAAGTTAKLERRLALPDLSLGGTYDQNSNYIQDYWGLNAGIVIPLFDRNQGGIARSKAELEIARTEMDLTKQVLHSEVYRALADLRSLQNQHEHTPNGFAEQLDQLSESLIDNYIKANLSLLEFTDLFEAYTASIIGINALEADLQSAYSQLEFVTGQRLFER